MGILDQFKKSKEKKEQTTPPPQGHTLAEVLQDKNKSHLFGKLLEEGGNKHLAARLAEGKLEESDIQLLEEQRKIFSEKITQSEKVERLLTKENIIDFARNHPEFEKIINLVGPEKAIKVIQSQLKEISITDEGRFNVIASLMEAYDSNKNGEYKEINDKVGKLLKDNKISEKEYLDVLAIVDPDEKEKALKRLSVKTFGGFKKALNYFGLYEAKDTFESLKESEISLEDSITQLNIHNESIGSALFLSVSGNDDMRKALFGELLNEKAPEEPKSGFREAKKETFNESEFGTAWEDKKKATPGYATLGAGQEAVKQAFIDEQKKAYKEKNEGKGFWHEILSAITEALISSKKDKLK